MPSALHLYFLFPQHQYTIPYLLFIAIYSDNLVCITSFFNSISEYLTNFDIRMCRMLRDLVENFFTWDGGVSHESTSITMCSLFDFDAYVTSYVSSIRII